MLIRNTNDTAWENRKIVILPTKGNNKTTKNYRITCLLSNVSKYIWNFREYTWWKRTNTAI